MNRYLDDRPEEGIFRVHRDVFADPELLELEIKYIFERTWNFLGLDSQIAKPHDFLTGYIARTPVLVTRDKDDAIRGFVNICRHKGVVLTTEEQGQRKYHVCPYHGWAYDSAGCNIDIKDRDKGCYPPSFDADNHDLLPLAGIASYRGLIFGSLSPDVPSLEEFLGDMRFFLDLAMEQGPQGMEFVPGRMAYSYRGNWKLQLDNGVDPYHLTSTHASFLSIQARRSQGEGHLEARQFDIAKRAGWEAGTFAFKNGHSAIYTDQPEAEKRPNYPQMKEIGARVGKLRADWMLKLRNTHIFPNLQIADAISLMVRTFRPLAVDLTEMRSYCLAPIGEPRNLRAWRLRQFEDFFNPSGFATPDDAVIYEECQRGFRAKTVDWLQGYERGSGALVAGPNDVADMLGIKPEASLKGTFQTQAETAFHAPHREWRRLIEAGLAGRKAYE